jgi:hypothetical protein
MLGQGQGTDSGEDGWVTERGLAYAEPCLYAMLKDGDTVRLLGWS